MMHYEQSRISQPEEAPDVGAKIRLGPPRIVMAAPLGDASWGSFNFPNIWRLRDGRLVCAVTIGQDEMSSDADYHYLWYLSDDEGEHWTHAVVDENEAESFLRESCANSCTYITGLNRLSGDCQRWSGEKMAKNHHELDPGGGARC